MGTHPMSNLPNSVLGYFGNGALGGLHPGAHGGCYLVDEMCRVPLAYMVIGLVPIELCRYH